MSHPGAPLKDQYVADINDFYKYQMLRILLRIFPSVLVAWMLTKPDGRGDGGRIGYLSDPAWRTTDPELFDELATLVKTNNRRISAIEGSQALPGCGFDSRQVPNDHQARAAYFRAVTERVDSHSLVFLDPDNGLEVSSVPKHRHGAERYLFWDELHQIRDTGASVLVYQHFPRVNRAQYLQSLLSRMQGEMGNGYVVFASHSSLVAFLFAVRIERAFAVEGAIAERCAELGTLSLASPTTKAAGGFGAQPASSERA